MAKEVTQVGNEPTRPNVHVRPSGAGWAIMFDGADFPMSTHSKQAEALSIAREISRRTGVLLVVHNADGTVRNSETNAR